MPWKVTCQVNERLRFVVLSNESELSFAALCRQFSISRKTGYKWLDRYEQGGAAGLESQKPIALLHPNATPAEWMDALVLLRKEYPHWGPKKLRERALMLGMPTPAASTIGAMLKRNGLVKPRRRRVRTPPHLSPLHAGEQPNEVWCVDFKGNFALGDKARCYPLTITDHASRYLIKCEGMLEPKEGPVRMHFERAFNEFGLPDRVRSDNGVPFASVGIGGLSKLSVWLMKSGVEIERIEPGKPQQNGRHERMHRTLKEDVASPPKASMVEQQRAFDRFRGIYNDERPHEALGQKTPSSRYTPSRKPMTGVLRSPEYPDDMQVRKVQEKGTIGMGGKHVHLTTLLAGEPVGLQQTDDAVWNVFYGSLLLGELKLKDKELRIVRAA